MHAPAERCAAQQFGTEIQTPALGLISGAVGRIAKHLPGRNKHERILLIVVFLAPVYQGVGALGVFQKHHIHAHILPAVGRGANYSRAVMHIHLPLAYFKRNPQTRLSHTFTAHSIHINLLSTKPNVPKACSYVRAVF